MSCGKIDKFMMMSNQREPLKEDTALINEARNRLGEAESETQKWQHVDNPDEMEEMTEAKARQMLEEERKRERSFLEAKTWDLLWKALNATGSTPKKYLDKEQEALDKEEETEHGKEEHKQENSPEKLDSQVIQEIEKYQEEKQKLTDAMERVKNATRILENMENMDAHCLAGEAISQFEDEDLMQLVQTLKQCQEEKEQAQHKLQTAERDNDTKEDYCIQKAEQVVKLCNTLESLEKMEENSREEDPLKQAEKMSSFYQGLYQSLKHGIDIEILDDVSVDKGGNPVEFSIKFSENAQVRVSLRNASDLEIFVTDKPTLARCKCVVIKKWPDISRPQAEEILTSRKSNEEPLACTVWKLYELVKP